MRAFGRLVEVMEVGGGWWRLLVALTTACSATTSTTSKTSTDLSRPAFYHPAHHLGRLFQDVQLSGKSRSTPLLSSNSKTSNPSLRKISSPIPHIPPACSPTTASSSPPCSAPIPPPERSPTIPPPRSTRPSTT